MWYGWRVRENNLEQEIQGYSEMRLLLGCLLVAIKRHAPEMPAEHLAYTGVWLLKECVDGMTDEVFEEWRRLAALSTEEKRRVLGDKI